MLATIRLPVADEALAMADRAQLMTMSQVRSQPRLSASSRLTILGAMGFVTAVLMILANGGKGHLAQDGLSLFLTVAVLFMSMATLTLASISTEIRLGLQMISIFFFIYLVLPGYHHVSSNTFPFYSLHYSQHVLNWSTTIVFVFFSAFVLGYYLSRARPRRRLVKTGRAGHAISARIAFNWPFSAIMLAVSLTATALLVRTLGVSGLLATRDVAGSDAASLNTSDIGLLVSLPRTMAFLAFFHSVAAVRYGDRRDAAWVWLAVQTPLFLFSNWPLNLARYVLFGYMLAIFVLVMPMDRIRMRVMLSSLFVVGALIVMPVISAVTRGGQSISDISFDQQISNFLESGDFDGMQSINNAVIHVDRHGLAFGQQLLSDILFFVPRSAWSGKGDPSGTLAAQSAGYDFLNISMPLPGEVYIDFGWSGVVIGGLMLGWWLRRLDDWIAARWDGDIKGRVIGSQLVAFSIILLRGSILAVIGNIVVVVVGSLLVLRFGLRRSRRLPPVARAAGHGARAIGRRIGR